MNPSEQANPVNGTKLACGSEPVELSDVIERVESCAFLEAIRFENVTHDCHYFEPALIAQCRTANKCNLATARVLLSMSYGLYQIMGFNLYHPKICNYQAPFGDFLTSRLAQRKALKDFMACDLMGYTVHDLLDPLKREHFALKYNGPGNVAEYSAKLLAACQALGVRA